MLNVTNDEPWKARQFRRGDGKPATSRTLRRQSNQKWVQHRSLRDLSPSSWRYTLFSKVTTSCCLYHVLHLTGAARFETTRGVHVAPLSHTSRNNYYPHKITPQGPLDLLESKRSRQGSTHSRSLHHDWISPSFGAKAKGAQGGGRKISFRSQRLLAESRILLLNVRTFDAALPSHASTYSSISR